MPINILTADCREWEGDGLYHAILTDPPYELGFMGRDWDKSGVAFQPATWGRLAEHLYPGAFGMAFASARGWHRLACAIEDAGLIIHPTIFGWNYSTGFPKSTRIDTQIDKAAGAERETVGMNPNHRTLKEELVYCGQPHTGNGELTAPATDLARAWAGHRYGLQAMKPALEPIIVFQKPYEGKPVECITRTGAGSLWIDGARIGFDGRSKGVWGAKQNVQCGNGGTMNDGWTGKPSQENSAGRWPSNFILMDSAAAQALDAQSGESGGGKFKTGIERERIGFRHHYQGNGSIKTGIADAPDNYGDTGGASRFFFRVEEQIDDADPVRYVAKASRKERDAGLDGYEAKPRFSGGIEGASIPLKGSPMPVSRNPHPTVKPIALARYLATLLLPPAEYAPRRILVPFAGVMSEAIGAHLAGWEHVTAIEREAEYAEIGMARVEYWCNRQEQFVLFSGATQGLNARE